MKNKEIVVISGKGGTGKTSVTASLAFLAGNEAVIADCDVDAADMHLLLMPDLAHSEEFFSGQTASINNALCTNCGLCQSICRFQAISNSNDNYVINKIDCEGCGYCARICPSGAIKMEDSHTGSLHISNSRMNNTLVHAELQIAAENSGKLVTKVRQEAKRIAKETNTEYIIIDGSPGIGCPVVASITGTSFVVIVTEPTVSGYHDLSRISELVKKFNIKMGCVINKSDLNTQLTYQIKEFLISNNIELLTELPYDNVFTKAITAGKTVVEYATKSVIESNLSKCWDKIKIGVQ